MYINIVSLNYLNYFQTKAKDYYKIDYAHYFLILIKNNKHQIIVQHIDQTSSGKLKYVTTWCSKTSEHILRALLKNQLVSNKLSNSHSVYIGCELTKAEMSIILNQEYVQN